MVGSFSSPIGTPIGMYLFKSGRLVNLKSLKQQYVAITYQNEKVDFSGSILFFQLGMCVYLELRL